MEELDIVSDDAAVAAVRSVTQLFHEYVGCNRNPLRLLQDKLAQLDQGGGADGEAAVVVSGDDASIRKASVYLKAVDTFLLNVKRSDWRESKKRASATSSKEDGVAAMKELKEFNRKQSAATLSGELNMAVIDFLLVGAKLSA